MRLQSRLQADLAHALDAGLLEVWYQPIVTAGTGRVQAMEALARWRHPERGYVPAPFFVRLAEENGQIVRLGTYVLRRACAAAVAWDWDGIATADVTQVAGLVNIDANGLTNNSDILSMNTVVDVNQVGGSLAVGGNKAYATTQQLAGVTVVNLDGVPSGADVGNIGLSVNDVNQIGVSIAAAGDIAKASVSNLAGVGVVSVNVAD